MCMEGHIFVLGGFACEYVSILFTLHAKAVPFSFSGDDTPNFMLPQSYANPNLAKLLETGFIEPKADTLCFLGPAQYPRKS